MRVILLALVALLSACATSGTGGDSTSQIGAVTLERTLCYGFCPDYTVTIAPDGAVTYEGRRFVRVTGRQTGRADPAAVAALHERIRAVNFFDLRDEYRAPITDLPAFKLTVTQGGRTKTVIDYAGTSVGMPREVRAIEDEIDRIANTAQWVANAPRQPR